MTPARWKQIRELLERCLDAEPHEHDALLTSACVDDADLRREVESLLQASSVQDHYLDRQSAAAAPFAPGDLAGGYRIVRWIGAGGMGTVYEAVNESTHARVALKTQNLPDGADPSIQSRFLREARLACNLHHPNIVTTHHLIDDRILVMEFVDGEPLSARLAGGPLPVAEALSIASSVAAALAHAHAAGVLHRDLKTANIMLTSDGVVKVLDFGAAKQIAAEAHGLTSTATGIIVGSPAYMSPEQAMGKAADARSDVFAFGVVLYEMLTGIRVFERTSTLATLSAVVREAVPPVRRYRPEAPAWLEGLVRWCLNKDASRRPASMAEVEKGLSEGSHRDGWWLTQTITRLFR